MKIKIDFVTNSSSSAFIVSLKADDISEFEDFMQEIADKPDYQGGEGLRIWERFDTIKELYEHATGRPYDWASKPFHPQIENMDEEAFNECLAAIKDGYVALYVAVQYDACDEFENSKYKDCITSTPL